MNGLRYQLKNIRRDKMCIMTFLLPVLVGIALNLLSGVRFGSVSEPSFGIAAQELSDETVLWLKLNGCVTQYGTERELWQAVNNPSTQMIGVRRTEGGIRTVVSGDELEVNRVIADTLPQIYENRKTESLCVKTIVPVAEEGDGLRSLLIVLTLVTAMFMGCTFNAMNIIGEKEDGVALVNRILPMTAKTYLIQKTLVGFLGGALAAVITAVVCVRVHPIQVAFLILIVVLSSFIAALMGLYIGRFSGGLMVGIVYIKAIMIVFLAPPIFFWLMVPVESVFFRLSYLLPSSAAFYGLMELAGGKVVSGCYLVILAAHAVVWFAVYLLLDGRGRRRT